MTDDTTTWLVGIPVRLRDETMRDRAKYLALVESVRTYVASLDAAPAARPSRRALHHAWALVCKEFDDYEPIAARLAQPQGEVREFFSRHVASEVTVKLYMALTGATLTQVVSALLDQITGDVDDVDNAAPPVGEATP